MVDSYHYHRDACPFVVADGTSHLGHSFSTHYRFTDLKHNFKISDESSDRVRYLILLKIVKGGWGGTRGGLGHLSL